MQITAYGKTDLGQRESNEDLFVCDEEIQLYLVCDGLGGYVGGDIAASMAAKSVSTFFHQRRAILEQFQHDSDSRTQLMHLLEVAVLQACEEIYHESKLNKRFEGMGTTLTMLLFINKKAAIAHVGDSRIYLSRGGNVSQLSKDHTLAAELLSTGSLTPEEAINHPTHSILLRTVGRQASVKVDTLLLDALPGDAFLLCTNGVSDEIKDLSELAHWLEHTPLKQLPQQLIHTANQRGNTDNATALVLHIEKDEYVTPSDDAWSAEVLLRLETLQRVHLFQNLDISELSHIMNIALLQDCQTGQILMREGEAGDELHIILEGQLHISRAGQTITTLTNGDHVGDMSLLNQHPRSATATAMQPTRLLTIRREQFHQLLREQPSLCARLLWNMAWSLSIRLDANNVQFYGPHLPFDPNKYTFPF